MGKRTIIFRADGGPTIGMGHFIRTLALAEMLNQHFHCIYATQKPNTYQIDEIEKVCHSQIDLPEDNSHFDVFLSKLSGKEIVVIDNYYFTTEYQHSIKSLGCKLVCIDDMHDKHYVADIVINHAEGIDPSNYSTEKYTKLLLGYKFALLRKDYLQPTANDNKKKYSCFLMLGGADPLNLTKKLLALLEDCPLSLPIAVVVGNGYSNEKQLKSFQNINLFKGVSAKKILQLMQQSQFGILPASTVAIEACAVRLPFLCGYFVDNQKEIYRGIDKNELAICVDSFISIDNERLLKAIDLIIQKRVKDKLINNQSKFLDKGSRERFIKIFEAL